MTGFKTGQRVKVEYQGEIIHPGDYSLTLRLDGGGTRMVRITDPAIKITPLDPPDWPPQVGDIWEVDGKEWFAAEGWGVIALVPAHDGLHKDLAPFRALNPVLVRRRGQ